MPARRGQGTRGTQFAQLTAFVAVAEHRSFTRAAEHLGISTPSLSQAVRGLEESFGVRLLNRTTRSVALTEAGEQLLQHLNPVLEGVDHAIDSVNAFRDTPSGNLRLTVHPVAAETVLGPLISRFAKEYPQIELEVSVDIACRDIVSEHFDAGINFASTIAQDMIAVPVGTSVKVSTVAAPEYLAANPQIASPADLAHHNCIRYRWDRSVGDAWKFAREGESVEVAIGGALAVTDHNLAMRAAIDSVGIAQLPDDLVAEAIWERRLVRLLPDWSPEANRLFLFYPSRRHVPTKMRVLADLLRKGR
jgi:DNA-binding transcriptional LysR family regulator